MVKNKKGQPQKQHVLTIALEDYFHGPAFTKVVSRQRWGRFETRFENNCLAVLSQLAQVKSGATFFVNSWVAGSCPEILREVIRQGHEVALAGQRGASFRHQTPTALRDSVRRDRDIVEQACGRRVLGFRVTDVLLRSRDLWALEVLAREGFLYDSSLSPFLRAFSVEPWRRFIHRHEFPDGSLWEVPLASQSVAGFLFPVAGGNYYRQFPEWLVELALQRWIEGCDHPLVLYFRLWDLDPLHPRLQTGSRWRDFRHYRNSERIVRTLNQLLSQLQFTSIAAHLHLQHSAEAVASRDASQPPAARLSQKKTTPISIIVPCFNEQSGIPYLARSLRELKTHLSDRYDVQFILVDDGSRDQTWRALEKYFAQANDTILLQHPENRGVSAAIMTGLSEARDIACSIDCDCSYDPNELKPMLALLADEVDLVTASPYHPAGKVSNVPRWRLFLSRCSCSLYRAVTGKQLNTFTACMRVYRRSSIVGVALHYQGFLGVAELISRLALNGNTIVEHPATLEVRIFGQSKMKVFRNTLGHLGLLSELIIARFRNPTNRYLTSHMRTESSPPPSGKSPVASEVKS